MRPHKQTMSDVPVPVESMALERLQQSACRQSARVATFIAYTPEVRGRLVQVMAAHLSIIVSADGWKHKISTAG